MKLKVMTNPNFAPTLQKLMSSPIPAKTAFKLAKLVKEIEANIVQFNTTRGALLERLSNKDAEGKPVIIENNYDLSPENLLVFNQEINQLLDEEIPINPISIDEIEKVEITVEEIMVLGDLIK